MEKSIEADGTIMREKPFAIVIIPTRLKKALLFRTTILGIGVAETEIAMKGMISLPTRIFIEEEVL